MGKSGWDCTNYGPKPMVFQKHSCVNDGCGKEVWSKDDRAEECKDCLREKYQRWGYERAIYTKKPKKYKYAPETGY